MDKYFPSLNLTPYIYICYKINFFFLSLHRALWNLYIVHSPTNALLLDLEKIKIYIKIHINIAPTCFGLSTILRELVQCLAKFILKYNFS